PRPRRRSPWALQGEHGRLVGFQEGARASNRSGAGEKMTRKERCLMQRMVALGLAAAFAAACSNSNSPSGGPVMTFFVTSQRNPTGNLGGLSGADAMCSNLAQAAGVSGKTWRAYLSVDRDASNGNRPTNARDRIGSGPWVNSKFVLVANNVTELHAMKGNAELFVDERGTRINGQWIGS